MRLQTPQGEIDLSVNLPAVYNLYNAAAAFTAATSFGISPEICCAALGSFSCGFGRMELFPLAGGTRMMLVKNPAGCTQALEYLSQVQTPFVFVFCLNDRSADGTDVSWIWDAGFESLLSMSVRIEQLIVSGERAEDMRVRLKYAGFSDQRILVIQNPGPLVDHLETLQLPVFILPTYTAMLDLRKVIVHRCGGAEFWE